MYVCRYSLFFVVDKSDAMMLKLYYSYVGLFGIRQINVHSMSLFTTVVVYKEGNALIDA